jgi:sugar O-acyltransferase (sialic acid O-acetyltransferase NeuD family)
MLVLGAGGHARACIDVIEQQDSFSIAGLVASAQEMGQLVLGYRVVGTDEDLPRLLRDCPRAFIAIGQIKSAQPRVKLFAQLRDARCELPSIVSPHAYVSRHARLGAGTIVMHGAIVNAGATVGNNCIVNSRALIEHDAVIGDHCHISTGVAINGGARVGEESFVGSGSVVREGVSIGARSLIGMGGLIHADCPEDTRPGRREVP